MEKFLVVTYDLDFPQLRMMCYCLNKNWKGNKHIDIVVGKSGIGVDANTCLESAQRIANDEFDKEWKVNVYKGVEFDNELEDGTCELQVNKLKFTADDTSVEDTISIDSKDFLVKASDLSEFKTNDTYHIAYRWNKTIDDEYPEVKDFVTGTESIPLISILTPWIWQNKQINKFWNSYQTRYGKYNTWKVFPTFPDWGVAFSYSYTDTTNTMKFETPWREWCPGVGVWTHQTINGAIECAESIKNDPSQRYWKHSRKVDGCNEITADVLSYFGIPKEKIQQWLREVDVLNGVI